ncbi:hypothetical protein INR49_004251 [Caranx melampygus]|nr:hypothetical protein INR49_004251 [Caranx melampygus]
MEDGQPQLGLLFYFLLHKIFVQRPLWTSMVQSSVSLLSFLAALHSFLRALVVSRRCQSRVLLQTTCITFLPLLLLLLLVTIITTKEVCDGFSSPVSCTSST